MARNNQQVSANEKIQNLISTLQCITSNLNPKNYKFIIKVSHSQQPKLKDQQIPKRNATIDRGFNDDYPSPFQRMVHLLPNPLRVSSAVPARAKSGTGGGAIWRNGGITARSAVVVRCSRDYLSPIAAAAEDLIGVSKEIESENGNEYLAREFGWKVRKLIEVEDDLRMVATIQAEAFHEPVLFFNDFFYQFFQVEVLSALIYRLKNYPPDRYACLVAEAESESCEEEYNFVGVVDVTVAGDLKVKRLLPAGEKEYLFVSGIAVSQTARRRKVATALLKGCDMLAKIWGFKFLALSAYEDDYGARNLYSKAGYQVFSADPLWKSSWIGRKRCVTMIKEL